jgi:hypothetical protein
MTLEAFRAEIAECLCHFGQQTPKRSRPSTSLDGRIAEKKKKANSATLPPKEVRKHQTAHWPKYLKVRQRCKNAGFYIYSL